MELGEERAWGIARREYTLIRESRGMINLSGHHRYRLERMYLLALRDEREAATRYARNTLRLGNSLRDREIRKTLGISVDHAWGTTHRIRREIEERLRSEHGDETSIGLCFDSISSRHRFPV